MKITVTLADPESEVIADIDARDRRAFERAGRKETGIPLGSLQDAVKGSPETYIAWLAWHSLVKRGGRTELGSWPAFEPRVISAAADEESSEEPFGDPTVPAT